MVRARPAILLLDRLAKKCQPNTKPSSGAMKKRQQSPWRRQTSSHRGPTVYHCPMKTQRFLGLVFEDIYIDVTSGAMVARCLAVMRASRSGEAGGGCRQLSPCLWDGWPGSERLKVDLSASELRTDPGSAAILMGFLLPCTKLAFCPDIWQCEMENSLLTCPER